MSGSARGWVSRGPSRWVRGRPGSGSGPCPAARPSRPGLRGRRGRRGTAGSAPTAARAWSGGLLLLYRERALVQLGVQQQQRQQPDQAEYQQYRHERQQRRGSLAPGQDHQAGRDGAAPTAGSTRSTRAAQGTRAAQAAAGLDRSAPRARTRTLRLSRPIPAPEPSEAIAIPPSLARRLGASPRRPRILRGLGVGRRFGAAGQQSELRLGTPPARPAVRAAPRIPGRREDPLHQAVLQRVVRAPRSVRPGARCHRGRDRALQHRQLVVHGDAQCLERALGRVASGAPGGRRDGVAYQVRKSRRGRERFLFPLGDDPAAIRRRSAPRRSRAGCGRCQRPDTCSRCPPP